MYILILTIVLFIIIVLYARNIQYKVVMQTSSDIQSMHPTARNTHFNVVMQTTSDIQSIPQKVADNWAKFAPNVKRIIYDDDQCIQFLNEYFGIAYVNKFKSFKLGAYKADLFRYAWLYINGGVYMDIKTILLKPFDEMFPDPTFCYLVLSSPKPNHIYNGVIATPPKNPLMYELLEAVMLAPPKTEYLYNTTKALEIVSSVCNNLKQGINIPVSKIPNIYLFVQVMKPFDQCDNIPDRYKLCAFIEDDGKPILRVRYSDYPWKR